MKTRRFGSTIAVLAALVLVGTVSVSTSFADDDEGREVHRYGVCSMGARWELGAEDEGSRIDMEFDVDATAAGRTWHVKLRHEGDVFATLTRTTDRQGDFEVERSVRDTVGADTLRARAVSPKGQVCKGGLSI
ncbi:MAG: hypothetical protein ACM3OO_01435 [Planctomycetaceae bacterium]